MKKISIALLVFSCAAFMAACSSDENQVKGDEQYIAALQSALENHWNYTAGIKDDISTTEAKTEYTKALQIELDEIGDLSGYTFDSSDLEAFAKEYEDAVNLQMSGVGYIADYENSGSTDVELYNNVIFTYQRGLYERYVLINEAVETYGLTVDDLYQSDLDEVITNNNVAQSFVDVLDYLDACDEGENGFEYVLDESKSNETTSYYTATLENTSGHDISDLTVYVSFVDEDGVIVYEDTDVISYFYNGKKIKSTIAVDSDLEFSDIEINFSIAY